MCVTVVEENKSCPEREKVIVIGTKNRINGWKLTKTKL